MPPLPAQPPPSCGLRRTIWSPHRASCDQAVCAETPSERYIIDGESTAAKGVVHLEALDLAKQIVDLSSEKQASDILMLDIREVSLLADYFVICSAASERQINAIRDDLVGELRDTAHRSQLRSE